MVAKVKTVSFQGIDVKPVDVQVQISNGLPAFTIVGLPDKAVAESKERVRAALHALGLALPPKRLTVNLAPADLAKEGSHYDLPIALGLLAAMDILPKDELEEFVVLGELSLDASIRNVAGVLPAAMYAYANDNRLICPADGGGEAAWAGEMDIVAPRDLLQLLNHMKGNQILSVPLARLKNNAGETMVRAARNFSEVKGQESAKRALEVAAAGGHNVLMSGPPGSGKSMLASCFPGILPPPDSQEILEASMIHSLAGSLPDGGIIQNRPFRDPHHSASQVAMIGGGHRVKPGEISLAHGGVLFLDELPEFSRGTLEALRQPLESGRVLIARANSHVQYPARFQLIAAMNPCRCGHLGDAELECTKAPRCGSDYQAKISGPILDRFDIHIDVPPVSLELLQGFDMDVAAPESSEVIAQRVVRARHMQMDRLQGLNLEHAPINAYLSGDALEQTVVLNDKAKALLQKSMQSIKLSARGYYRVLKLARTIADLAGVEGDIGELHLSEALGYRKMSY